MPPQSCLTSSTVYFARLRSSVGLVSTCFDTFSSILLSRVNIRSLFQLLTSYTSFMTLRQQRQCHGSGSERTIEVREWIELFERSRLPIGLSVSIDGGTEEDNAERVDLRGRSSLEPLLKSLRLLQQNPIVWSRTGFLKVINPSEDPIQVAENLLRIGIRRCDFLQPLLYWGNAYVSDEASYQERYSNYWPRLLEWWWNQGPENAMEIRTLTTWGSHLLGVDQHH